MIQVPSNKPHIPASVAKEGAKEVTRDSQHLDRAQQTPNRPAPPKLTNIGRGPEMDAAAIAVRLSAMATEAKKKDRITEFKNILEEVIRLTGLKNPEAALEEANRRLQQEIEAELERIKSNAGLMEEAQDWQRFGDLLERMGPEAAGAMLDMMKEAVKELS